MLSGVLESPIFEERWTELPAEWLEVVEEILYQFYRISAVAGFVHVAEIAAEIRGEEPPGDLIAFAQRVLLLVDLGVSFDPLPFEEAIEAMAARAPIPPDLFAALDPALRHRAFTAAHVAGTDVLTSLRAAIVGNLEDGETIAGFISHAGATDILDRAGFGEKSKWYWETVLRTNEAGAYNVGRWAQVDALGPGAVVAMEFVGILDERTTEICQGYASPAVVAPVDDAIWGSITPPNHFNCRSSLRPILAGTSEARALETGARDFTPTSDLDSPAPGFERSARYPRDLIVMPDAVADRLRSYDADVVLDGIARSGAEAAAAVAPGAPLAP